LIQFTTYHRRSRFNSNHAVTHNTSHSSDIYHYHLPSMQHCYKHTPRWGCWDAGINDPPKEWRRPRGRPRQTRLCTVENDLKHQNLGLWSARHSAYDRDQWRDIVETATLLQGHATWWWNAYSMAENVDKDKLL